MTQHKNRKQAIRDRMQADQVPYTEAAGRIDAENADPAPVVRAFPGIEDDVVCGHLDRRSRADRIKPLGQPAGNSGPAPGITRSGATSAQMRTLALGRPRHPIPAFMETLA